MKILVAYASKTGTAKECAEMLGKELRGVDVVLSDLADPQPDISDFDAVVVGSSIRYGKIRREAREFLTVNHDKILQKPHGLFLCLGSGHGFEDYVGRVFPTDLCDSAVAVLPFGGRLRLKNANLFERILLHTVRSKIRENEMDVGEYTPTLPDILPENISRMAALIRVNGKRG